MFKNETVIEPEVFGIELPDEPPTGSVVLDRYGRAWQRLGGRVFGAHWEVTGKLTPLIPALADVPPLTWGQLLLRRGDLTLVYRPEKKEDAK